MVPAGPMSMGVGLQDPATGLSYPEVLGQPDQPRGLQAVRGMLGVTMAVLLVILVVPVVAYLLQLLGWSIRGGDWAEYRSQASAFAIPEGMLAAHLALASLIPASLVLVAWLHRVRPQWLVSVQPGMRWRYLLVAAGIAVVVFNVVLVASEWGSNWQFSPQPGFWWFLVVIVLTSPLQAAAEEFLFRGYLMQALNLVIGGRWFSIVASALIFALFHGTQNLPLFLDRFGFGVLAGVLVLRTGGLEAAIAAHIVNNLLAFSYAGLTSSIAEVKATQIIDWPAAGWDLAGFALYTVAALWLARRMRLATTTP